jgi:hypothetical protein
MPRKLLLLLFFLRRIWRSRASSVRSAQSLQASGDLAPTPPAPKKKRRQSVSTPSAASLVPTAPHSSRRDLDCYDDEGEVAVGGATAAQAAAAASSEAPSPSGSINGPVAVAVAPIASVSPAVAPVAALLSSSSPPNVDTASARATARQKRSRATAAALLPAALLPATPATIPSPPVSSSGSSRPRRAVLPPKRYSSSSSLAHSVPSLASLSSAAADLAAAAGPAITTRTHPTTSISMPAPVPPLAASPATHAAGPGKAAMRRSQVRSKAAALPASPLEETKTAQQKHIQQQEPKLESSAEEHETQEQDEEEEEEAQEEAEGDASSQVGETQDVNPASSALGGTSSAVTAMVTMGSRARRGGPLLTLQHIATALHEPELIRRMG